MSREETAELKNNGVIGCVKRVVRSNWLMTTALFATVALSVLAALAPPQIMRIIIDKYLMYKQLSGLIAPAVIYLLATILAGIVEFLQDYLLTYLGQRTIHYIRSDMMAKLARLPSNFYTNNSPGSVVSRIMKDVENIDDLFSDGIVSMVVDSLTLVGIIISIWIFSLRLALIALGLIPLIFLITRFFQKRMLEAQVKNLEQLGKVNAHITESVRSFMMIKLFAKECYMEEKYCGKLKENYKTNGQVIIYDSCYSPVIQLIRAVVISLIAVLSSEQIGVTGISAGMLAATISLISSMLDPVESLGTEIQSIQSGISGFRRINSFFSLPDEHKEENLTAGEVIGCLEKDAVSFENLSFSYDENVPVLKRITTEIHTCESVTIAGRTGVGKTTLFGLVLGLISPTEGRVLIGGFDADNIPDSEKRKIFGYVEQSFRFIPGTVAEQISLGDPEITPERIRDVCKMVGLAESIEALPRGYDTTVFGNGSFSWGQCQLLSIARAVAANPKILLLDEITANLDSATEERIMQAITNVSLGRTVLAISHRESAMRNCNRLIYMENGEIIFQGSPDEIIKLIMA